MIMKNGLNKLFLKAGPVAMCLVGTLLVSACEHGNERYRKDHYTGSIYKFAHTNHPIEVSKGSLSMAISVGRKDTKLTPEKRDELKMFLHYYRDQGTGPMWVSVPVNAGYNRAVQEVLHDVKFEMEHMSLGPESIRVNKYVSNGNKYPAIRLTYKRYVANGPVCEGWNENLAQDENNDNSDHWGCATQKNLAAMVANPRDLKGPRGWSPRDARRRDTVWDKFVKGESTGSQRSRDERVDASGIQQQ